MKQLLFSKRQVEMLKEGNAYVKPNESSANTSSIASDINAAQKENPTDDSFVFDTNDYDGNGHNNEPTVSIDAKNPQDAQQQYNNMLKNPDFKRLVDAGAVCKVNLEQEGAIRYTKNELNKILFA